MQIEKKNLNLIKAFDNMYPIMKKSCFYVEKIFELRILLVSQQLAFNIHVYGKKKHFKCCEQFILKKSISLKLKSWPIYILLRKPCNGYYM